MSLVLIIFNILLISGVLGILIHLGFRFVRAFEKIADGFGF